MLLDWGPKQAQNSRDPFAKNSRNNMRLIHISDLHQETTDDHKRVIDALCKDISNISKEKIVDAIICTGDIANKGGTHNALEIIGTLNAIKISAGREVPFIVCPGNHDINLRDRDEIYQAIFDQITNPSSASKLIDKISDASNPIIKHLDGYINIAREVDGNAYSESPFFYTKTIQADNVKIGFASINSSWTTKGGGTKDYGALFIGEKQIDLALKEIGDCHLKIAIMHHTIEWLAAEERSVIQRALSSNFDALFCGHNHENNVGQLFSNIGTLFTSNTGCIYQSRKYFNGYSVVDLNVSEKQWRVQAREYYYQRNEFDISVRFAPNGEQIFDMQNHSVAGGVVVPGTVMAAAQERANAKLLSFSASDIAPKQVGAIFVEPPLALISEKRFIAQEGLDDDASENLLSISSIANYGKDILLIGKRESGKTILLHHIAVNRFMEFYHKAKLSIVIDVAALPRLTKAAILEHAIAFIDGELPRKDLVSLLKDGLVLVGFDNIQLHNPEHEKLIKDFCEEYPEARYILAAAEEIIDEMSIEKPPSFGRDPLVIYIHSLRNRHIKELVFKWFGDQAAQSRQRISLVDRLISRLNVPKTPFLVSVLLWVIEQKPNANLINQASAIEVLIEGLLEKFKESKSRSEYDSTIQQHFLSEFSLKLDREGVEWIPSIEFEGFVVNYFKTKGLEVSIRGFTDELIRKGLIFEGGQRIAFKFDCFRAFFLAKKFAEMPDLWCAALNDRDIGKYVVEFDLFTGLHRDRKDVLEAARKLCHKLLPESGMSADLGLVVELGNEGHIFDELRLSSLEEILDDPLNDDMRDDFASQVETPSVASIDHEASRRRQKFSDPSSSMNFIASLRAFSIILRNSELIDDVTLKRSCLDDALRLWAQAMLAMLEIISGKKFDEVVDSGVKQFGGMSKEEFKSFAKLVIPLATMSMMSESLATPKLNTFVMERTRDAQPAIRTFAVFLTLDTVTRESAVAVKELLKDHGKNSIITQTLFFKLMSLYVFGTNSESMPLVRECLADAFTALKGGSLQEKSIYKARFLQGIDKKLRMEKEVKSID